MLSRPGSTSGIEEFEDMEAIEGAEAIDGVEDIEGSDVVDVIGGICISLIARKSPAGLILNTVKCGLNWG